MANYEDLGVGTLPAAASGVLDDAKEQVKNLASQAKNETVKAASQARYQMNRLVTRRKDQTAERLQGLAGSLRDTAHQLQEQDANAFGRFADRAAEQVERLSSYLLDHDIQSLVRDAETFARRRPALFLGGTFLAGFALARFLKSSAPAHPDRYQPSQQPSLDTLGADAQTWQRSSWAPEPDGPGEAFIPGTELQENEPWSKETIS